MGAAVTWEDAVRPLIKDPAQRELVEAWFCEAARREWLPDAELIAANYGAAFPAAERLYQATGLGLGKMNFLSRDNLRYLMKQFEAVAAKRAQWTRIGILAMAEQRHGGTLLYTLAMIEALRLLPADHYQWTLYTPAGNHEYDGLGLPIARLASPGRPIAARVFGKDPFAAVDKVIAPIYSAILLATSRPFAFTLHDLQERHFPEHFSHATRWWRHAANRLLTARAGCVICESDFVKRDIVQFCKTPPPRIVVVPSPPVLQLSGVDGIALETVRQKFNLPMRFAFYPAQFWPHKNHMRLIEAFAQVAKRRPDCHLVLTGKQRDEYDRVFARVAELGLRDRVHHTGYVEQSELGALFRCATLAVIPTLYESISIPVFEAFSLGTPICASNVVALPEQVGDAGLLFDPLSPEDIAEKMLRLFDDAELRRQLAERGRRRMTAVTSADYAAQLASILDALK